MTVLQVCAFGAKHPGNFIASLESLERALARKGIKTIYAFVERAIDMDWCKKISERTTVYFLPEAKARILPKTYQIMRRIYAENQVDIVHTHFELYDIPATVCAPKNTKIYWHLHDPIMPGEGLRSVLWKIQYGVVGKRATLLSVAEYYRNVVVKMGFPNNQTALVLNGIDMSRIERNASDENVEYDFLTFGWDFKRKGDDIIIQACDKLEQEGYKFKLLLNGNEKTWFCLEKFLDGKSPSYLVKGEPTSDVNSLFKKTKIFVQASRRETFSYAVCEAAYAGLPIISSEIPGLEWAHSLPTVSFFENEDVQGLYQLMKAFLERKTFSECDIYKSQEYIKEHLSIDAWTKKIIQYYGV